MRISLRGRRRAPSLRPPSLAPGIGLQQKGFRFSNAVYMWIVCTTKGMTRGGGSSLGGPAAGVGALGCIGAFRRLYWPQIDAPQTVTSVIMGRPAEKPATPTCVAASPGGGRLLLPPPPWPTSVCRSFQRTTENTAEIHADSTCAAAYSGSATARRSTLAGSAVFSQLAVSVCSGHLKGSSDS